MWFLEPEWEEIWALGNLWASSILIIVVLTTNNQLSEVHPYYV